MSDEPTSRYQRAFGPESDAEDKWRIAVEHEEGYDDAYDRPRHALAFRLIIPPPDLSWLSQLPRSSLADQSRRRSLRSAPQGDDFGEVVARCQTRSRPRPAQRRVDLGEEIAQLEAEDTRPRRGPTLDDLLAAADRQTDE